MWCKNCKHETPHSVCELCGEKTSLEPESKVYWCENCNVPIIRMENETDINLCPLCRNKAKYLASDLRVVFPEERLLIELLLDKPLAYLHDSVWANNNRYYVNGKLFTITSKHYKKYTSDVIIDKLEEYRQQNSYDDFNRHILNFVEVNQNRLQYRIDEAHRFILKEAEQYPVENIVLSFSGGKDSTVTADLVVKALSEPSLVHIFGNTTLEFPLTMEYTKRFRAENPLAIFRTAINREQNFYDVCEDIGPPARMMRWCCSMFKTGPITRVLNRYYRDKNILTFYGIRKCESVSRSKYNRVEDDAESIKIQKQKVASPIFYWADIDIWLYILGEKIDFNDAYRLVLQL